MSHPIRRVPRRRVTIVACAAWASVAAILAAQDPQPTGSAAQTPDRCRVEGRIRSGATPLPGVSLSLQRDDALRPATSTDRDGKYTLILRPGTYHLAADLTAFTRAERDLTLGPAPCDVVVDFELALGGRAPGPAGGAVAPVAAPAAAAPRGRGRGGAQAEARGGAAQGAARFQTLNVQAETNAAATLDVAPVDEAADVARLLPPGFSIDTAQADAIAINGGSDATSLDRGQLNDRRQAIRLGEFDPGTVDLAQAFAAAGGQPGAAPGGPADLGGQFGRGGRGGPGGRGGRGGGPGRGGFVLGGRGARAQSPYQGSTTYTFGGSALDAPPYQLRPDVPVTQPQFSRNNFGATFGGPLKIPGLYADTNRRTNFQLNYTGNQSYNVFDQYATVPTDAMRQGDFSASPVVLVDPTTGQPFAGNQIPQSRIDPTAAQLLSFIPSPNLPGSIQNYHVSTTSHTTSDNFSLRISQNLSPTVPQGPGQGGGRGRGGAFGGGGFGGGRGGFGGPGGPGGRGGRGTTIMLTGQLQYRRTANEALNVFPNLGGTTTNTSVSAPITLNVVRNRVVQNFTVNLTHSGVSATNGFSGVNNVGGLAGIQYPAGAATDPLNWGPPNLTFSGFTGVRSAAASQRSDNRLTAGYMSVRPLGKHQVRLGGDYRYDRSTTESNPNPRGTFTFTGLYSSAGSPVAGRTGADFADFLLGVPQQASLQVAGPSTLRQRSFDMFLEDNWQRSAKLTFNLGVRYELAKPYVEVNGRMANLDVTPTFTAAAPVVSGEVGPYTGAFPAGLLDTDANNVAPRVGVAYRIAPNTVFRTGYGITYNSGSYASIARQLVGEPPFADTDTNIGAADAPLTLAEGLLSPTATTTNNYGVDKDYALGKIQTWNAALSRAFRRDWTITGTYTGTRGTDLDILRAPNRGPLGLLIPGVQSFIWESSGGRSIMHAGSVLLRRRLAGGIAGDASYTIARSMDNASSLGAGAQVVAQNDQDLASEWALSSFDRRHQFAADLAVELPFGPNRRWLKNGGLIAGLAGEWTAQLSLTLQSGTPFTARVIGAATDVSRGTNGSLRADYNGSPIQLSNPTVDEFFNVNAFSVPASGQFGDSSRNLIVGPGARQLNGSLTRDLRVGGNRAVSLQVNAQNLLNTVQWASIDTNVNSPTFGQVLSARPMRTVTVNVRFRVLTGRSAGPSPRRSPSPSSC